MAVTLIDILVSITHNIDVCVVQKNEPMKINELTEELFVNYEKGAISNSELVQIIELASKYLNLKTITNYAKVNEISYNGALKRKTNKIKIDKVMFIIDND